MDFIAEKLIKVKKHGLYHVPAYLLQSIRRSVSPHLGSILMINHRLPAEHLLLIAERNHTIIQMTNIAGLEKLIEEFRDTYKESYEYAVEKMAGAKAAFSEFIEFTKDLNRGKEK